MIGEKQRWISHERIETEVDSTIEERRGTDKQQWIGLRGKTEVSRTRQEVNRGRYDIRKEKERLIKHKLDKT